MRAIVERDIPRATWDQLGRIEADESAFSDTSNGCLRYPSSTSTEFDAASSTSRSTVSAAPGRVIMPLLLERLGCDVTGINLETDGRFPRPPEPVAENLGELERLVLRSGAAIGLAVDPDVDRLALVSDAGNGDRRGLHAGARGAGRAAAPHGPGGHESVHEPDRRGCGGGRRGCR